MSTSVNYRRPQNQSFKSPFTRLLRISHQGFHVSTDLHHHANTNCQKNYMEQQLNVLLCTLCATGIKEEIFAQRNPIFYSLIKLNDKCSVYYSVHCTRNLQVRVI